MDIGGLLGDLRVIVPNRVALRVSEIHFLLRWKIFNHVFGSLSISPFCYFKRANDVTYFG